MKKIIVLTVAAILAMSLFACSGGSGASTQPATGAPVVTQAPVLSAASAATNTQASQATGKQSQASASATADQSSDSVLDDINTSLNNLGGAADNLETVNPADMQD